MEARLKGAVLVQDEGAGIDGADLQEVVARASRAGRLVEIMGRRVGNRDVVEQAAIAGLLNAGMLDNTDAAA